MVYWAIAQSEHYPDVYVGKIEAESDEEAAEKAKAWHREKIGFRYGYVVTKEIKKNKKDYKEFVAKIAERAIKHWGGQK